MRRLRRAIGPIPTRNHLAPIRNNHMIKHTSEMLQTSFRLIIWHFVSGLIHPREAKIAILAHLAVLDAVNKKGRVARGAEGLGVREVGSEGYGFAAEPVADVICVAVEECDADAVGEDFLEVFEEVGEDEVAGAAEAGEHGRGAGARVVDVYAESFLG